jgi:hypothetical protein
MGAGGKVREWGCDRFFLASRKVFCHGVSGYFGYFSHPRGCYFGYFSHHGAVENIVEAVLQIPIMGAARRLAGSFPSPAMNLMH